MNHILLLGAGFSNNWGGWLASEVMADVLGRVSDDDGLSGLVHNVASFEDALTQVQADFQRQPSATTKARLDRLQGAILGTFGAMNQVFAAMPSMEFSQFREFSIQQFLSRFDAIFTLNQDLLFELHYLGMELHNPRRWNGYHFPAMQPPPNWQNLPRPDRLGALWRSMPKFQISENLQPIFKLHGSINWRDASNDGELLVMGANKQAAIGGSKILSWYSDQFRGYLGIPNTRLMVIGYSFSDHHINTIIHEVWQKSGLKMFIVDPLGRDVLNKFPQAAIRVIDRLEEIQLIGESRRPLRNTFGGDLLEHGKFMRYFAN